MAGSDDTLSSSEEANQRALAGVQAVFERWFLIAKDTQYDGFDLKVMRDAKLLEVSMGPPSNSPLGAPSSFPSVVSSTLSSLYIDSSYRNLNGVMHGGAYGVIFDMLTTIVLGTITKPGYWDFMGGVTRVLNISYLKAVPVETTVHIHAHIYQVGRTMVYIKGWMTSEDGKTIYATCEHHKVHVPSKEAHLRYRIPWDDRQKDKGPKL